VESSALRVEKLCTGDPSSRLRRLIRVIAAEALLRRDTRQGLSTNKFIRADHDIEHRFVGGTEA
jgi:hypothetical protein